MLSYRDRIEQALERIAAPSGDLLRNASLVDFFRPVRNLAAAQSDAAG